MIQNGKNIFIFILPLFIPSAVYRHIHLKLSTPISPFRALIIIYSPLIFDFQIIVIIIIYIYSFIKDVKNT